MAQKAMVGSFVQLHTRPAWITTLRRIVVPNVLSRWRGMTRNRAAATCYSTSRAGMVVMVVEDNKSRTES